MELLTMPEVARELGLSRQRVHQLADDGILKTVSALGPWRGVRPKDLEEFKKLERKNGRPKTKKPAERPVRDE